MALSASFVATRVYYESLDEVEDAVMDESVVWMIVGGLSGLWVSFFACFLLLMKRKYVATFFSFQSGHAWVKEKFFEGGTDELKAWTLACNKMQWMSIRGDVKEWTLENWERWEEEKPDWVSSPSPHRSEASARERIERTRAHASEASERSSARSEASARERSESKRRMLLGSVGCWRSSRLFALASVVGARVGRWRARPLFPPVCSRGRWRRSLVRRCREPLFALASLARSHRSRARTARTGAGPRRSRTGPAPGLGCP